jgi:3-oxoacyl-[acyl-carrier protein] reductase
MMLSGQIALVSGSDVIAEELRHHGATVETVDSAGTAAEADAVVERCLQTHGRLDVVVNAGSPTAGPGFLATTDAELLTAWREVVATAFALARAAVPHMITRGYGRIVEVADGSGLLYAHPDELAVHDMTMGSLTSLWRTIAAEGKTAGVATNAVLAVPGEGEATASVKDGTVLAAAGWLASPGCDVTGRFFAAGGARMAEVFTWAGHGYQSPDPGGISIEEVRANWEQAQSPADGIAPADQVEYNGFRTAVYRSAVGTAS